MTDTHVRQSAKVAGKQPAQDERLVHESASASVPQTPNGKSGVQTRQKRILPSRSRRGGPGVGGCDLDIMILETGRRRLENEPLLPANTRFLLTTKSSLVPSARVEDTSDLQLNTQAYGRYFDRPEVQDAYKRQQMIETPEFTQLPEDATVGGRFRPRGSEEEMADTSDAAYEKRHRKYESFEKRQRLREKEKLKHEQYKLKERIEQLRAMDTAAFLALPASQFSEPPGVSHLHEYDETDTGLADLPGAHVNGAAAYNEAERRRKEMLDIAMSLEERYRVLLPPDRKWAEKKERMKRESLSMTAEPEPGPDTEEPELDDASEEEDELVADNEPETPAPAEPEPEVLSRNDSDGESEVDFEQRDRERSKKLKLRIKFPPRRPAVTATEPKVTTPKKKSTKKPFTGQATIQTTLSFAPITIPVKTSSSNIHNANRSANGRFMPKSKTADTLTTESISTAPPKKRPRATSPNFVAHSPAPSKQSHASTSERKERSPCLLMVAAIRNSSAPSARKTQRNVTAFGVRVPPELEDIRDYEIPLWLSSPEEDEDDDDDMLIDYKSRSSSPRKRGAEDDWCQEASIDIPQIATLGDT